MAEVQKTKLKQNPEPTEEATIAHLPSSRPSTASSGDDYGTEEKIALGIFGVIMTSIIGAGIWFGIKDEKERVKRVAAAEEELRKNREIREAKAADIKQWREQSRNDGFIVLELKEGILVAVPADSYKEARFKETR